MVGSTGIGLVFVFEEDALPRYGPQTQEATAVHEQLCWNVEVFSKYFPRGVHVAVAVDEHQGHQCLTVSNLSPHATPQLLQRPALHIVFYCQRIT
eukprot:368963-Amphidinium_carterae.2